MGKRRPVNYGTNATAGKGQIALQAEGSEVEFRKVDPHAYYGLLQKKDIDLKSAEAGV